MADIYNNRATVTLGGNELVIVASKLAERIYGDRFRNDVAALGEPHSYRAIKTPKYDDEGKPVVTKDGTPVYNIQQIALSYTGRLKMDVATSANINFTELMELPDQVIAATWAMAKAAGSTEDSFEDFFAWWLTLPSCAEDDIKLWEAVCVDLAERAFFRGFARPNDASKSDEKQQAEQQPPNN